MAQFSSVNISGVTINLADMPHTLDALGLRLKSGEGFSVFTLNLDHLVKLQRDPDFRRAYRQCDFVTADGWPVVSAAKRKGILIERTTGADVVDPLCALCAREGYGVYFVGPGERAQSKALDLLKHAHSDLIVAGSETPQLDPMADRAAVAAIGARINASGARLCFVSLGAPKQEKLSAQLRLLCPKVGFISVGAALDFIAGEIARAPIFMRRMRLEWFWRLALEPRRLGWRYAQCFYVFGLLAIGRDPVPEALWGDP